MKSVRVAVAAAVLSLLAFAVPVAATEDPPDCTGVVDLDDDVAVELHVDVDPCRPVPGTPCTVNGQPGVFNLRGRCICTPPTTVPPTTVPTTPPTTAPPAPPTTVVVPTVEVPVVETVVVQRDAPPAQPVRAAPSFTG